MFFFNYEWLWESRIRRSLFGLALTVTTFHFFNYFLTITNVINFNLKYF